MTVTDYPADRDTYEFVKRIVVQNVAMVEPVEGMTDAEAVAVRAILASAAFLARAVGRLPLAGVHGPVEWQMAGRLAALLADLVAAERAERANLN